MPRIKIKRGTGLSESTDKLLSGELAIDTSTKRLYAGDTDSDGGKGIQSCDDVSVKGADNATYATKIGSESSHPSIGGDTDEDGQGTGPHYGLKPVYVNDEGGVTEASGNHGSPTNPVYVSGGGIQRCRGNVGGDDTPAYMSDGTITPCTKYGGGTKVILNGTSLGGQDATIYAPTDVPTGGVQGTRILLCLSNGTPFWSTGNAGATNKPMYLYNGRLLTGDKYAGGTNVTANGTPYSGLDASFYAPTDAGTSGQVLVSKGSGYAPEWKNCQTIPSILSPTSISDNGIYVATIRVYFASVVRDCTVLMVVKDKNTVNWSSVSTAYEDPAHTNYNYVTVQMRRETDGSLGAYITDYSVMSGNVSCSLIYAYKLADTD